MAHLVCFLKTFFVLMKLEPCIIFKLFANSVDILRNYVLKKMCNGVKAAYKASR